MQRGLDETGHQTHLPYQADFDSLTVRSVLGLSPPVTNAWSLQVMSHSAGCHKMVLGCYLECRGSGLDRYFAGAWTSR
jgi:hypothetical protein